MTTATMSLVELAQEVENAAEKMNEAISEHKDALSRLQLAATGSTVTSNGSAEEAPKRRGRPPAAEAAPKRRGRPPGSGKPGRKPASAALEAPKGKGKGGKRAVNEMTLREAVWNALDRDNWDGIIELPEDVETAALKPAEIYKVIQHEGLWKSKGNFSNQISQTLAKLRNDKKVVRDNGRYYIAKNAKLD